MLLIGECEDVQVNFNELDEVLRCVSALEAECPIVNTRLKRDLPDYPIPPDLAVEQMQADGPASIINQVTIWYFYRNKSLAIFHSVNQHPHAAFTAQVPECS